MFRSDRSHRRGGGTMLYIRDEFQFSGESLNHLFKHYAEGSLVKLTSPRLALMCLYLPPSLSADVRELAREAMVNIVDDITSDDPTMKVIILGDFNRFEVAKLMDDLSMSDLVNEGTRGSSVLDHILISGDLFPVYHPSRVCYEAPIGNSDHVTIIATPENNINTTTKSRTHCVFDYRESNMNKLLQIAESINWRETFDSSEDANDLWIQLTARITDIIHTAIPCKTVTLTVNDKSWMTPLTKLIINQKWLAYRQKNWPLFNHLKKKAKKEIERAKAIWAERLKRSTNGLWKLVSAVSGGRIKSDLEKLLLNNQPQDLADQIATNIAESSRTEPIEFVCDNDSWKLDIAEHDVERRLRKLSSHKATGPEGIPNKVYSALSTFIAKPLKDIFERSISTRTYPNVWKRGIMIPIPKTRPPTLDKLRTITLLPSPSKILERLVLDSVAVSLGDIIGPQQHAFRKGASTCTALTHITDAASRIFDDEDAYGFAILSTDFSKAFDRVDHKVLLQKMKEKGAPGGFLMWLKDYLSHRTFQVRALSTYSPIHETGIGVPQGSVLGPILFCALVSDLSSTTEDVTTVQYADDVNFIIPLKSDSEIDIFNSISIELEKVRTWCLANKQQLNTDKSQYMLYTRSPFIIHGLPLGCVSSLKILGVHVSNNLSWDHHIQSICKTACSRLHVLRVLRRYTTPKELHGVYVSLIRSLFDYCCAVFMSLSEKNASKLQRIDNRAHRIIYGNQERTCGCTKHAIRERRENLGITTFVKMLWNPSHPLRDRLPDVLQRSRHLQNFYCRTSTRQSSFIPYATKFTNERNMCIL